MPPRVKLCAIAQNEGAYLVDWIHHHLHFGFDAVEVWVNGSSDNSVAVMEAVSATREEVSFRVADRLLEDSVRRGKYFQHRAYMRQSRAARRAGFSHAAFLDLDEYWVPSDFSTPVSAFLPDDEEVNVVSFPWYLDVPDPQREPFTTPFVQGAEVQVDRHVKSVVRLDDRIVQLRAHSAQTTAGRRLLVRDPFPMAPEDEVAQHYGSFVTDEHLAVHGGHLPEALVLHALNRSATEYVASLRKAHRRSEQDSPFRTNRDGYLPTRARRLALPVAEEARAAYEASRARFREETGTVGLVAEAQEWIRDRADGVILEAAQDPLVLERLRRSLRGVRASQLDARCSGWEHGTEWWVSRCTWDGTFVAVEGWAFSHVPGEEMEFGLRGGDGRFHAPLLVERSPRPDVAELHPDAPADCGYRVVLPPELTGDPRVQVLTRPVGASGWTSIELTAHLARLPAGRAGSGSRGEVAAAPDPQERASRGRGRRRVAGWWRRSS